MTLGEIFRKSIDFLKIKIDSIMNHTEIPDKNMVSDNYRRIGDRYVYYMIRKMHIGT